MSHRHHRSHKSWMRNRIRRFIIAMFIGTTIAKILRTKRHMMEHSAAHHHI
jgi:hypothetical protein